MIPALAAAEADASRVECAPKMRASNHACFIVVLNHLAIVLDITALWDLMNYMNNLVSSSRSGLVLSRYTLRVFTRHKELFDWNSVKKTPLLVSLGVIVLPGW